MDKSKRKIKSSSIILFIIYIIFIIILSFLSITNYNKLKDETKNTVKIKKN